MNTRPGGDVAISPQDAGVCEPGRVSNSCGTLPPHPASIGDQSVLALTGPGTAADFNRGVGGRFWR